MQKLFNKILVPVNSGRNSRLAIDKALQLANRFNCDIHLLEIQSARSFSFLQGLLRGRKTASLNYEKKITKLKEYEDRCRRKLQDGLLATSIIATGNCQTVMKQTIITEHIDLVIVAKNQRRFRNAFKKQIDLNGLSQQTQCPILTVTRRFNLSHLQNIVVPVNEFLPVRKLTMATYLCRELHGSIHLMGNIDSSQAGRSEKRYLIKAYQLLSDYGHVKIHCTLPDNYDNPGNTLAYARNVKADLIVVNSGKESLLKGWWNRAMGNYLYKESDIPVLTVAPQNGEGELILN